MKGRDPNDILRQDGVDALRAASDNATPFQPDRRHRMAMIPTAMGRPMTPGARRPGASDPGAGVQLADFYAYMPQHKYIFAPSRELWPAASVNARISPIEIPDGKPMRPAAWLDANAAVEQMTWAPGKPMLIKDRLSRTAAGSRGRAAPFSICIGRRSSCREPAM